MSEEFKDFEAVPTLTLDPFGTAGEKEKPVGEKQPEEVDFTEQNLTPEERKMVEEFAKQIDITNTNLVLQYGAGTQKKLANFSESALENVRSKDLGEVGDMLANVVTELKKFDTDEESKKGFFGFLKRENDRVALMKARYAKTEENVSQICDALENHQIVLMKDIAVLDKMYDLNLSYFKELSMYILAGKKKLDQVRGEELPALMKKASASGLPEDTQAVKDLDSMCNRFEKKLHDLELTRMVALQTAPQIRLVQNNDTQMAEKIQSIIMNTIPLWKSQMVLALGVAHSNEAAKASRQVTDMTNELLKKNAETLKMASIETARESERGIVDIETLKQTNSALISTLDEVLKIQKEGHEKRVAAENEMQRIENEMKAKLLELSVNK